MNFTVWNVEGSLIQKRETRQAECTPPRVVYLSEIIGGEGVSVQEDLIIRIDVPYGPPHVPDVLSMDQDVLEARNEGSHR